MGTEYDYLGGPSDRQSLRTGSDYDDLVATPRRLTPEECEFLFIGGAGVQGGYLDAFKSAFDRAGIQNVRVPNSGEAWIALGMDVAGVPAVNDLEFAKSLVNAQPIKQAASHSRDLKDEQYNLGGYSYGSAVAAAQAYAIAENGGEVDNLVLVGSPLNRDLYDAVKSHPNIKSVIDVDLPHAGDPVKAGMTDWELTRKLPQLVGQMRSNTGHFYYSGEGPEFDVRRDALAHDLKGRDVR